MFGFKLLGIVISSLLAVSPVNFDYPNEIEFPFTRTDQVTFRTSVDLYDLGYAEDVDLATLSEGLTAKYENAEHNYMMKYNVHIYCSSACSVTNPTNGSVSPLSQDIWLYEWSQPVKSAPKDIGTKFYSFNQGGTQTQIDTYSNEYSFGTMNVQVPFYNGTWQLYVKFPAVYEGMTLESIAFNLKDFKTDYELIHEKELIYKLVLDKDIEYDTKIAVLQYVRNGQYHDASNYIQNYYQTHGLDISNDVTNISNDIDDTKNNFTEKRNQLITFEDEQFNTMNENLNALDFNFDGTQLQQSASFYKKIFTDFVGSTPLFQPIAVILFIILLMILLGAF